MKYLQLTILAFVVLACSQQNEVSISSVMDGVSSLEGKEKYLNSPFVTAGDRTYMVGHQDGSFPDHGWHVKGEMGGIWLHPIKLMDGFMLSYFKDGEEHCLNNAKQFFNYPFANLHRFQSKFSGLNIERFQYIPDGAEGVVVEYRFINKGKEAIKLPLRFVAMVDLRPVWLGERTGMEDEGDFVEFHTEKGYFTGRDSKNPWFVSWKSSLKVDSTSFKKGECSFQRKGKGLDASQFMSLKLEAGETSSLKIFIAGSYKSETAATTEMERLEKEHLALLEMKKSRFQELKSFSEINIPDKELEQMYDWTRYNTDWLIRDVPEFGRALSAGMADYPWWFGCDNTYSLQGVLATGRPELAISSLKLLRDFSEITNGNGRVVHEVSTNGAVFNPGNINETPHFTSMIRTLYDWTGDKKLVEEFYPFLKKGMDWLMKTYDKDNNSFPDGFGMMEIHGLNSEMIDVAVYTQQAFEDLGDLASILKKGPEAKYYRSIASKMKSKINEEFWVDEFSSYADFIGTTSQARHLIDDAIVRADTLDKPWAVKELKATKNKISSYPAEKKQGFVLHHNWVVNTPMEMGIADSAKAIAALETASKFVNYFGAFVTGIDRDESAGDDEGSFAKGKKIFSYTGAVMTLPTGVLAISENNYGRPDKALAYLKRLNRSFSYALPGSMYEVSPDFGMMSQAWNIYAINYPIVTQFFGIKPQAGSKFITLEPQMPSSWNEASISKVKIGDNELSYSFKREGEKITLNLEQKIEDWQIWLPRSKYKKITVNGKELGNKGEYRVPVSGAKLEIVLEE
ncbi:MAG: glycogen debranching protein [Bacteroidia bacterium]|nr:glycogen debranching protein [Bacteroidia bacterium]